MATITTSVDANGCETATFSCNAMGMLTISAQIQIVNCIVVLVPIKMFQPGNLLNYVQSTGCAMTAADPAILQCNAAGEWIYAATGESNPEILCVVTITVLPCFG